MSDAQALVAALDKWRGRWPEWNVAEVLIAPGQRQTAVAWFALRQELTDAAWAGEDPRPGEAKLGWWGEELIGWSQGRRRHPLGLALQRLPAPWIGLAAALPTLPGLRDAATDRDAAFRAAQPMAQALAAIGDALFAGASAERVEPLLALHLLARGAAAAPLQLRARCSGGVDEAALASAWATELLRAWPPPASARAERVFDALLRARVQRLAQGRALAPTRSLPALWLGWNAARG